MHHRPRNIINILGLFGKKGLDRWHLEMFYIEARSPDNDTSIGNNPKSTIFKLSAITEFDATYATCTNSSG